MTELRTTPGAFTAEERCDPATRATRSLLAYGVIAGPFYLVVGVGEALTRPGFDLTRHSGSLLSNGGMGWIHITNFVLTGLMIVAGAVGMRRALQTGRGRIWGPRLLAVYGSGLIGAGIFRADPAYGFPPGTSDGPGPVSWHGLLHFVCGGIGFLALITACLILARRFAAERRRGWAIYSAATGVAFLAAFAGIASASGSGVLNVAFACAVVLAFGWISALSVRLYRRARID
jgi:hypothetical protein